MKANKTMRGQVVSKHRKRRYKESESKIDSAAHNQILKQQKQLKVITTYLSILTMNVNRLNFPIKRHCLANWIKRKIQQSIVCRRHISLTATNTALG
jgi:hypothetical protein